MPYPSDHLLLSFGGPLMTTEEWSCGIRFSTGFGPQNQEDEETALTAAAAVLNTWFIGGPSGIGSPLISQNARLAWVKLNRIGVDGRYVREQTNLFEFETPSAGGVGTNAHPPNVALAVTFMTNVNRGLANRGRIYLPAPAIAVGSTGLIAAADADRVNAGMATLLTDLNTDVGLGAAIVASKERSGASRLITGTRVGRVLDTMRSRRAQLDETPSEVLPVENNGVGGDF